MMPHKNLPGERGGGAAKGMSPLPREKLVVVQ